MKVGGLMNSMRSSCLSSMKKWRTLEWWVVIGKKLCANFGLGFDGFFPRSLGCGEEDFFEAGLAGS